jgi:hypothetical protein
MDGNLRALLILIILIVVATITYYIVTESKSNSDSDQGDDKKESTDSDQDGDKKESTDSDQGDDKKESTDSDQGDDKKESTDSDPGDDKTSCENAMKNNNAESYELVDGKCKFTCPEDYKLIKDGTECIESNSFIGYANLCKDSPQYKSVSFDEDALTCNVECNSPFYIETTGNDIFNKLCRPNESNLINGFDCRFGKKATIDIFQDRKYPIGAHTRDSDIKNLMPWLENLMDSNETNFVELDFSDGYNNSFTSFWGGKYDKVPSQFKEDANTVSCTKITLL